MKRNEVISAPISCSDPEAASETDAAVSSSEVQLLAEKTSHNESHMETFEIEMGDGGDHGITGNFDDNNEINISNTDVSEVPSIMTAPSMDDSIDEDIVEMESLLRSNSGYDNNSKVKTKQSQSRKTNGRTNETSETLKTMKGGTAAISESQLRSQMLQNFCPYYCFPCCNTSTTTTATANTTKPYRMGNIKVVYPPIYIRTNGWFVFGPHWFGPPFILFIILFSSYYIIYERCYRRQWYLTTAICSLLCCSTVYHLMNTAYRDPGVITKNSLPINHDDPESIPRSYRYCDTCQYYQPSHAAHCPDCDVCVAGFDHHCVWMSICIGVGNYKVRMNQLHSNGFCNI